MVSDLCCFYHCICDVIISLLVMLLYHHMLSPIQSPLHNSMWIPVEIHHFSRSFLKIWCKVRQPEARPAVHRFGPAQPIVCTSKLDSEWVPLQLWPYKPVMAMGWNNSCNWLVEKQQWGHKPVKTVTGYDGGGNPFGKHSQKSGKRLMGKTWDYTRGHS